MFAPAVQFFDNNADKSIKLIAKIGSVILKSSGTPEQKIKGLIVEAIFLVLLDFLLGWHTCLEDVSSAHFVFKKFIITAGALKAFLQFLVAIFLSSLLQNYSMDNFFGRWLLWARHCSALFPAPKLFRAVIGGDRKWASTRDFYSCTRNVYYYRVQPEFYLE